MKKLKEQHLDKSGKELAQTCARAALEKKAEDLLILDVRKISSFADFFVIMSGRSTRHTQSLAETIESELRSKKMTAVNSEGLNEGLWVLLDYGDVVVHIFYKDNREFYDLEGLWHEAPKVKIED